jgi:hypothetical protein
VRYVIYIYVLSRLRVKWGACERKLWRPTCRSYSRFLLESLRNAT